MKKLLFIIYLLFNGITLNALDVDFILDQTGGSYKTGFSNMFAVDYVSAYLEEYKTNMENMLARWSDTHAVVSVSQPAHMHRIRGFDFGLSGGGGTTRSSDDKHVGKGTAGQRAYEATGFGSALFVNIPSETLKKYLPYTSFADTDLTIKFLPVTYIGFDDVKIHMINAGVILRREITDLYVGSFGIHYSLFKGREDTVSLTSSNIKETVAVDESTGGKVSIDDPSMPDVWAQAHYPYIKAQSLSIDCEIKQLWEYPFITLLIGAGCSINVINKLAIEAYTDVNLTAVDPSQNISETHNGRLIMSGTQQGHIVLPRAIFGLQFDFGFVKLPVQVSMEVVEEKTITASTSLTFSF